MNQSIIPDEVAQFVVDRIESVAQMEALLFLRSNSGEAWSIEVIAQRLYVEEGHARAALAGLAAGGLLSVTGNEPPRYVYHSLTGDLGRLLNLTLELYSKHLVPMTNLIHSTPKSRAQEFADAFRFKKEG